MSWTEFHPFVQEAILTTAAVSALVLFVLLIRKPFARRYGAKAAYLLWALPLARFVTPPLPGNWSLAGLLGFTRPAPESAASPAMVETASMENVWVDTPVAATPIDILSETSAVPVANPAPVEMTVTATPAETGVFAAPQTILSLIHI